jgi:hypothetical protein
VGRAAISVGKIASNRMTVQQVMMPAMIRLAPWTIDSSERRRVVTIRLR